MKTDHLAGVAFLCALVLSGVAGPLFSAETTTGGGKPPNGATPLYLRSLVRKPWWSQEWEYRIPVVVHESAGQERHAAPISIFTQLPEDAKLSSVRVVAPWGEEIPSQARLVEEGTNEVEVFFDTNADRKTCFQFLCNSLGTQMDLRREADGANAKWDADWTVQTLRGPDGWIAEFAIPFKSMGISAPVPGDFWLVNFCRMRPAAGAGTKEYTCVAPTFGLFYTPRFFAALIFR